MSDTPVDLTRLTNDFGDDRDFLIEIYTTYLTDCGERIGQLKAAIQANDDQKCAFTAHSIKGASANVGADGVQAIASEMEQAAKQSETAGLAGDFEALQIEFSSAEKYIREFLGTLNQ